MRHVHVGPELADAAGDQVRVAIELRERAEGGEAAGVLARKARQVEQHAVGERGQDRAHAGQIGGGEAGDTAHRLVHALQQAPLGFVRLLRRAGARDGAGVALPGVGAAQRLEVPDPLRPRDQPGVGDRVSGAGQQVREPQRLAERAGQDREREVEAAADLPQQVAEKLVTRSQTAAWADPGSPWPS